MNNLTNKTVSFFVNSSQVKKKPTLNCFLDFMHKLYIKVKVRETKKKNFSQEST